MVALLFIIFDVEVAFFFPWAAVFGKATQLAAETAPVMAAEMEPGNSAAPANQLSRFATTRLRELGITDTTVAADQAEGAGAAIRQSADRLARISIADIGVFFGVLLVGFAYVWKRGDLDWVRAVTRPKIEPSHRMPPRAMEPSQSILSA